MISSSKSDPPDEVPEVHPEQAVLSPLSAQLPLQVGRPAGPVVRPGSGPGEATPGVPELQQPEGRRTAAADHRL